MMKKIVAIGYSDDHEHWDFQVVQKKQNRDSTRPQRIPSGSLNRKRTNSVGIDPRSKADTVDKKRLGRGGFSAVYEVSFMGQDGKVFKRAVKENPSEVELKLAQEAEDGKVAKHVCRIQISTIEDKKMIVMPILPFSLSEALHAIHKNGYFDFGAEDHGQEKFIEGCKIVLNIALQLLKAMSYLHEKGIIWFDCKPDNIRITEDGEIQITDLGLAREVGARLHPSTASYSSPEMVTSGRAAQETPEKRAPLELATFGNDLWSFGVTFFELIQKQFMSSFIGLASEGHILFGLGSLKDNSGTLLDVTKSELPEHVWSPDKDQSDLKKTFPEQTPQQDTDTLGPEAAANWKELSGLWCKMIDVLGSTLALRSANRPSAAELELQLTALIETYDTWLAGPNGETLDSQAWLGLIEQLHQQNATHASAEDSDEVIGDSLCIEFDLLAFDGNLLNLGSSELAQYRDSINSDEYP